MLYGPSRIFVNSEKSVTVGFACKSTCSQHKIIPVNHIELLIPSLHCGTNFHASDLPKSCCNGSFCAATIIQGLDFCLRLAFRLLAISPVCFNPLVIAICSDMAFGFTTFSFMFDNHAFQLYVLFDFCFRLLIWLLFRYLGATSVFNVIRSLKLLKSQLISNTFQKSP